MDWPAVSGGAIVSLPIYSPFGSWYPFYSAGFGWNVGFIGYDPWHLGSTHWYLGRYGPWVRPVLEPVLTIRYYYGVGGYARRAEPEEETPSAPARRTTGSIRLRVSPASAKVYMDGALVGTVDEFNGFRNHLELESGRHQLELRADGYAPLSKE